MYAVAFVHNIHHPNQLKPPFATRQTHLHHQYHQRHRLLLHIYPLKSSPTTLFPFLHHRIQLIHQQHRHLHHLCQRKTATCQSIRTLIRQLFTLFPIFSREILHDVYRQMSNSRLRFFKINNTGASKNGAG